jgi:hypothetical protein
MHPIVRDIITGALCAVPVGLAVIALLLVA